MEEVIKHSAQSRVNMGCKAPTLDLASKLCISPLHFSLLEYESHTREATILCIWRYQSTDGMACLVDFIKTHLIVPGRAGLHILWHLSTAIQTEAKS